MERHQGLRQEWPASEGFDVGGKTGTADKVVNGRYVGDKNFNAFLAAFPIDNPRYVVLTFIDEPKTDKGNGAALPGNSAATDGRRHHSQKRRNSWCRTQIREDGSALLVSY